MNTHASPPNVLRFPPRLRVVPAAPALDRLLEDGAIGAREHAAGLAYRRTSAAFGRAKRSARWNGPGLSLPRPAWLALKAEHAALLRAAGADRFALDRLCLDDDTPLRCEVERVRAALGRVALGRTGDLLRPA